MRWSPYSLDSQRFILQNSLHEGTHTSGSWCGDRIAAYDQGGNGRGGKFFHWL